MSLAIATALIVAVFAAVGLIVYACARTGAVGTPEVTHHE